MVRNIQRLFFGLRLDFGLKYTCVDPIGFFLLTNDDFRMLPSLIDGKVFFGVLIYCVSSSYLLFTVSTSSTTISCVQSSPKTTPVLTHVSVIVVEGRSSPINPWCNSGGILANLIHKVNNLVLVLSILCFNSSSVQECF